ncbi:HAUS augmin-like complex subunit 1 [Apophysomyces sp. BC1034]|nr:HAUS augmin-like complex subunit 1 [Apophysomyces sp. BC1021]KAG0188129.1 HAUS augmin-like complex subunit 1 [Apophysomyces sp. BC1034]
MAYQQMKPECQVNTLGIDKSSLSDEGALTLEVMASLAVHLGIDSDEIGSYIASIAHLRMEYMDVQLEHTEMEEVEYALDRRIQDANQELFKLKNMLQGIQESRKDEQEVIAQWQKDTKDLQQTIHEQKGQCVQQQKNYDVTGVVQQRLRLVNIKRLDEELHQMETDLSEKKRALEAYGGFPPDMVLASLKVQESEDKLHQLRQERERLLADMAENVH